LDVNRCARSELIVVGDVVVPPETVAASGEDREVVAVTRDGLARAASWCRATHRA
jgi:hypothetical protein